jgi:hypothetical protein
LQYRGTYASDLESSDEDVNNVETKGIGSRQMQLRLIDTMTQSTRQEHRLAEGALFAIQGQRLRADIFTAETTSATKEVYWPDQVADEWTLISSVTLHCASPFQWYSDVTTGDKSAAVGAFSKDYDGLITGTFSHLSVSLIFR